MENTQSIEVPDAAVVVEPGQESSTPTNWVEILLVHEARYTLGDDGVAFDLNLRYHFGEATQDEIHVGTVYRVDDPYKGPVELLVGVWLEDPLNAAMILPYVAPPPAPPQPYNLQVATIWGRFTDDEAEAFDGAMATASPLRLRKQFNAATAMMSNSELFTFTKGVMLPLFSETRTNAILQQ